MRQVGYLQEMNRDARSTTHKIVHVISIIYLYHSAVTFWLYLAIFRVSVSTKWLLVCRNVTKSFPYALHQLN